MKKIKKFSVLALTLMIMLLPAAALAHGLFLTLEEPGVLKAEYDGGGFSPRMEVTIFDADGNELDSGTVDDNGEFHFDPELEVAKATVDDGMGHHAEYEQGKEVTQLPKVPIVIGVFVVIGLIFFIYYRKKGVNKV